MVMYFLCYAAFTLVQSNILGAVLKKVKKINYRIRISKCLFFLSLLILTLNKLLYHLISTKNIESNKQQASTTTNFKHPVLHSTVETGEKRKK